MSSLVISAFLVALSLSLSLSFSLQDAIRTEFPCPTDLFVDSSLASWSSAHGVPPPVRTSHKQSAWDQPGIVADRCLVESSRTTPREKAVLLSSMANHSGEIGFLLYP